MNNIDMIQVLHNVLDVLDVSLTASCTCMTKTPDIDYHAPDCRYKARTLAMRELAAVIDYVDNKPVQQLVCTSCGDHLLSTLCYACSV